MKKEDPHKTFTAIDFQRYHTGELSMQERHALEKAALEDPFLADALEGYANATTPLVDLAALKDRLELKTSNRKRGLVFPMAQSRFMRVAALVLLLAGAGWAVYQFSFTRKEEMAINKDVSTTSTAAPANPIKQQNIANDSIILPQAEESSENVTANAPVLLKRSKQEPVSKQFRIAPASAPLLSAPVAMKEAAKDNTDQEVVKKSIALENATAMTGTTNNQQALNTFRGQIVDPNGNPVPFANIVVAGKPNAISTNTQGQFYLTTPDSVVNASVAAAGFQSNRFNLVNPAQEQKLVLNEANTNLQEVVVTGYGQKRSRTTARPSDAKTKTEVEELEPEGGWSGFNNYISQNLHIPEEVSRKQLKGEVELSFDVDKNGEPINIKIKKSLCTTCDQEAIRLLKEGPAWKKKRKKGGKVTIRF